MAGWQTLLVSLGAWERDRDRAERLRDEAAATLTTAGDPTMIAAVALLRGANPPRVADAIELPLAAANKAILLVALGQRFPAIRAAVLATAERLAHAAFPPSVFVRRVSERTRTAVGE